MSLSPQRLWTVAWKLWQQVELERVKPAEAEAAGFWDKALVAARK